MLFRLRILRYFCLWIWSTICIKAVERFLLLLLLLSILSHSRTHWKVFDLFNFALILWETVRLFCRALCVCVVRTKVCFVFGWLVRNSNGGISRPIDELSFNFEQTLNVPKVFPHSQFNFYYEFVSLFETLKSLRNIYEMNVRQYFYQWWCIRKIWLLFIFSI